MKTAREHAVDLELAHVTEFEPMTVARAREVGAATLRRVAALIAQTAADSSHQSPVLRVAGHTAKFMLELAEQAERGEEI
jgi:hypothetical protein